jgi:uncharacterized integral membrane protein
MTAEQTPTPPDPQRAPRRRLSARTPEEQRLIAIGALAGIVGLFALVNLDEVKVDWIVTSWRTPLIFVIVLSAGLGALAGVLIDRRRSRLPPPD